MSPNRIVALLTPIIAGVSGWIAEWCAQHLPGTPSLDSGELTAVFIAGATAALGAALTWLHGWQKHEDRQAIADLDLSQIPGE